MTCFQAKTGSEKARTSENKNYRSNHFLPDPLQTKIAKIAKKIQKLKNTIMAFFQAKRGWERPRKSENKNYRSYHFLPVP